MNGDVIPLEMSVINRASVEDNCAESLREIEEPFISAADPYYRRAPQADPTFFFGRRDVLDVIPAELRQGQHCAVLGLRRIGKTSVLKQVENRIGSIPFVSIEVISHDPSLLLFRRILEELRAKLVAMKLAHVPDVSSTPSEFDFRDQFLRLYSCWESNGWRDPFVLILDEAERPLPATGRSSK